jgi:hypothetical protein
MYGAVQGGVPAQAGGDADLPLPDSGQSPASAGLLMCAKRGMLFQGPYSPGLNSPICRIIRPIYYSAYNCMYRIHMFCFVVVTHKVWQQYSMHQCCAV